jgi:hypothetical protein
MKLMIDIALFKRMISPLILQLLFWAGVFGCMYGGYVLLSLDHWAWPFPLFIGPLLVRVIFEGALLSFRVYDQLVLIADRTTPDSEGI